MPGLMSNVFGPDDETGQSGQQNETTITGDGETGVEASPSVTIGMSGSHEDADGSTSEWSNETEIGADVDLDAAIATSSTIVFDSVSE